LSVVLNSRGGGDGFSSNRMRLERRRNRVAGKIRRQHTMKPSKIISRRRRTSRTSASNRNQPLFLLGPNAAIAPSKQMICCPIAAELGMAKRFGRANISAVTIAGSLLSLSAAESSIGQIPQNDLCWLPVVPVSELLAVQEVQIGGLDSGALVEVFALRLRDGAAGRHALRQPDAAADRRTAADGDAPENRRSRIDDNVVFNNRVTVTSLDDGSGGVDLEPLRPKRHRLIESDAAPEPRRLADHHAGAVVDEEALADFGAGMDVDPGLRVGEFCDDPGQQRRT
jgi:hypothetical protein